MLLEVIVVALNREVETAAGNNNALLKKLLSLADYIFNWHFISVLYILYVTPCSGIISEPVDRGLI